MYDGYRLKIEGVILENKYITKNGFLISDASQIVEEYDDEYGKKHIHESDHTRTIIEFNLCERNLRDNQYLMELLSKKSHVHIEYYDDKRVKYNSGDFRRDNFKLEQKYIYDRDIWYKETAIRYEEY